MTIEDKSADDVQMIACPLCYASMVAPGFPLRQGDWCQGCRDAVSRLVDSECVTGMRLRTIITEAKTLTVGSAKRSIGDVVKSRGHLMNDLVKLILDHSKRY